MSNLPPVSNYPREGSVWGSRPPGVYFEFISTAFSMIQQRVGTWLTISFFSLLLAAIPAGIAYAVAIPMVMQDMQAGNASSGMFSPSQLKLQAIMALIQIPLCFIYPAINLSFALTAIDQKNGRPVTIRLGDAFKNFGSLFVASILYYLAIQIGMMLCYIPGLVLMGLLSFFPLYIYFQNMKPLEALQASVNTLKPYWIPMAGLSIVASIASGIGVLACCIGILFTFPVFGMVIGLHWDVFFPEGSQEPQMPPMQTG